MNQLLEQTETKDIIKSTTSRKLEVKIINAGNAKDYDKSPIIVERHPVTKRRTRKYSQKIDANTDINANATITNATVTKNDEIISISVSRQLKNAGNLKGIASIDTKVVKSERTSIAKIKHGIKTSEDQSVTPTDEIPTSIVKRTISKYSIS